MQHRGLIDRETDGDDGRGCVLHLTDHGVGVLERAAPGHLASVRARFLAHITADELATLGQISTRVADLPD